MNKPTPVLSARHLSRTYQEGPLKVAVRRVDPWANTQLVPMQNGELAEVVEQARFLFEPLVIHPPDLQSVKLKLLWNGQPLQRRNLRCLVP